LNKELKNVDSQYHQAQENNMSQINDLHQ